MTITDGLQAIFEYVEKEEHYLPHKETEKVRPDAAYDYLRPILDLTDSQLDLLSVIVELAIDGNTMSSEVAQSMGLTKIKFLSLKPDLDVLASKRYILYNPEKVRNSLIVVPTIFIEAISQNRIPIPSDFQVPSTMKFAKRLDNVVSGFFQNYFDFKTLISELDILYASNQTCEFVETYNRYELSDLDPYEKSLFNFMMGRYVCRNENSFVWEDYCKLFEDSEIANNVIYKSILNGNVILMEKGLVEYDSNGGFTTNEVIRLTAKAINDFLGETVVSANTRRNEGSQAFRLISHDSLETKDLFFNKKEQEEICRLKELLQKENFKKVTERLEEKHMRKGFACLFYGPPGTGKTASCFDIAAATGRDIYYVDMSQVKSKWVGDSERNLSALFQSYKKAVRERDLAPIMVWNEADAIFGCRRTVTSAVDKMENTMINIILEELENLEGILIATTNMSLKDGFDPAMERRFLIKVHFDNPEPAIRTKIWLSMFGELSESDAKTLASEFEFSGGLIENINRKATVEYILSGQKPRLDYLRTLCHAEKTESNTTRHIGFNNKE